MAISPFSRHRISNDCEKMTILIPVGNSPFLQVLIAAVHEKCEIKSFLILTVRSGIYFYVYMLH